MGIKIKNFVFPKLINFTIVNCLFVDWSYPQDVGCTRHIEWNTCCYYNFVFIACETIISSRTNSIDDCHLKAFNFTSYNAMKTPS